MRQSFFIGAGEKVGPPGYMSVPFHTKMARANHLYKLVEDGLIVGGAIVFKDKIEVNELLQKKIPCEIMQGIFDI